MRGRSFLYRYYTIPTVPTMSSRWSFLSNALRWTDSKERSFYEVTLQLYIGKMPCRPGFELPEKTTLMVSACTYQELAGIGSNKIMITPADHAALKHQHVLMHFPESSTNVDINDFLGTLATILEHLASQSNNIVYIHSENGLERSALLALLVLILQYFHAEFDSIIPAVRKLEQELQEKIKKIEATGLVGEPLIETINRAKNEYRDLIESIVAVPIARAIRDATEYMACKCQQAKMGDKLELATELLHQYLRRGLPSTELGIERYPDSQAFLISNTGKNWLRHLTWFKELVIYATKLKNNSHVDYSTQVSLVQAFLEQVLTAKDSGWYQQLLDGSSPLNKLIHPDEPHNKHVNAEELKQQSIIVSSLMNEITSGLAVLFKQEKLPAPNRFYDLRL